MLIALPISPGELVDRLTILDIKSRKIRDAKKLRQIKAEKNILENQYRRLTRSEKTHDFIRAYRRQLYRINEKLWSAEDEIRNYEYRKDFGNSFIKLARSVYKLNDKRFEIKQQINRQVNSLIGEVKEYTKT